MLYQTSFIDIGAIDKDFEDSMLSGAARSGYCQSACLVN